MSGLLSTVLDAQNSVLEGPWTEQEPITSADELTMAVGDFLDASLTEKIRAVLAFHDENGLPPSDNETNYIMTAINAYWGKR